jgi:hypothetical protein
MEYPRVAIATRVAPSFLRVGQVELFARRVRQAADPADRAKCKQALKKIVAHLIEREYPGVGVDGSSSASSSSMGGAFREVVQQDADKQRTPEAVAAALCPDPDVGGRTEAEFQAAVLVRRQKPPRIHARTHACMHTHAARTHTYARAHARGLVHSLDGAYLAIGADK